MNAFNIGSLYSNDCARNVANAVHIFLLKRFFIASKTRLH